MYFLNHNAHTSPLLRELNILKLPDKIALENFIFINKYFNKYLLFIFKNWSSLSSDFHTYNSGAYRCNYCALCDKSMKFCADTH